jgi:uncharacterized RDD family membrane protein YckC
MTSGTQADPSLIPAGFGERTGAAFVDLGISVAVFGAAIWIAIILFAVGGTGPIVAGVLVIVAGIAVALLHTAVLMARQGERNGQSVGKQALDVRVVTNDGEPVRLGTCLVREVAVKQFGTLITGGLFLPVDYLWPLFDDEDRAIHDIVAETRLVPAGAPRGAVS